MDALGVTIYTGRPAWQHQHADALASGLRRHGIQSQTVGIDVLSRAKRVACWGWRNGKILRQRGHDVLVMERGYLGDRFSWSSLGWNGLNGRAKFPRIDDPSRFAANFGPLAPWKQGGEYVLLIGQVATDASIGGFDIQTWYETTATKATAVYGLPVRFRPHPMAANRGLVKPVQAAPKVGGSLAEALAGAAVTIVYNSNSGVDAAVAGCPVVALDCGTMAWEVAGHGVGELARPEREAWAARLAWCQWTMEEIKSGKAWEAVGSVLSAEKVAA